MNVRVSLRIACASLALAAIASPARAKTSAPTLKPLTSFRMLMVDSTPQGTSSRQITFVSPDKLRVEIVESKMVVVAIAKNVWLRQPNGSWQKADYAPGVDPLTDIRATLDIGQQLGGPQSHFVEATRLDGVPVDVYDVSLPPRKGFETPKTRIWIGKQDGYPHQVVQRNGGFVFTAKYSAWNQPLSVSGP